MMITLVVAGPAVGIIAQVADFQTVIFTGASFAVAAATILGGTVCLEHRKTA